MRHIDIIYQQQLITMAGLLGMEHQYLEQQLNYVCVLVYHYTVSS